jgi:hypothetical protein
MDNYFRLADNILEESENLDYEGFTDSKELYQNRDERLQKSLSLQDGYLKYKPEGDFKELAFKDFKALLEKELTMPISDEKGIIVSVRYTDLIKQCIYNYITLDDFVSGNFSVATHNVLKSKAIYHADEMYGYDSIKRYIKFINKAKISSWLAGIYGQSSIIMSYWTNKRGVDGSSSFDSCSVHISVLPHHIAGMSYFASANWGGKEWSNSYKGTSCQDTLRAGDCETIFHLPPNLLDTQLAIAYLTDSSTVEGEGDINKPIYQARTLLRYLPKYDVVLIQKVYGAGVAREILEKALKNKFPNCYTQQDIDYIGKNSNKIRYKFHYTTILSIWSSEQDDEYFTYPEGLEFDFDSNYTGNKKTHSMIYKLPVDFVNHAKDKLKQKLSV